MMCASGVRLDCLRSRLAAGAKPASLLQRVVSYEPLKSAIACEPPQQSLRRRADRKAGDNVAGPMREKKDPACNEAGADNPHDIALAPWQSGCCRSQRADMDRMAGGKCIHFLARYRYSTPMTPHGQSIGAFVIEYIFEQMRKR